MELLPPVLAGARTWGNDPALQEGAAAAGGASGVIAWLADAVQEVTMERDQVDCRVWPVCTSHRLGGHALVRDGAAIWWCNGAGGHVLAPSGICAVDRPPGLTSSTGSTEVTVETAVASPGRTTGQVGRESGMLSSLQTVGLA